MTSSMPLCPSAEPPFYLYLKYPSGGKFPDAVHFLKALLSTGISLQPTQSSLLVLTSAADMLPATPYIPIQHANSFITLIKNSAKWFLQNKAQTCSLPSPNPSCSSMTGMQLAEMMFVPNSSEDNGKHAAKPNYLNQCKSRLCIDAIRDFAEVLYLLFAHKTSFNSFEVAVMQFALRKKVFDCMDTLNKNSRAVWEFEKAIILACSL